MKLKKLTTVFLLITLLLAQFSWLNFINAEVYALNETEQETVATKYFYNQLTSEQKQFYNAIEELLKTEDGKVTEDVGTKSIDITKKDDSSGFITQQQLEEYANGSQHLLLTMGAALDAFSQEHMEFFYIDYDFISLRVTKKNEQYTALIGTGRGDTYLNKAFLNEDGSANVEKINNAIESINTKVDAIVQKAKTYEIKAGQNLIEEQIKIAHDEIIKSAEYKYEYQVSVDENAYTIRNIYGVLESHEAVCEGYSRTLKMVLDKLGIPCIPVVGVYKTAKNQNEEHMWTYVMIENGKWYAVDPTFDNTDLDENGEEVTGETRNNEVPSREYFIVGLDKMSRHIPTGIISTSNYEFTYPELESVSDKFETVYNMGLLKVEMAENSWDDREQVEVGIFRISYDGKNYKEAAKEGKYIIINMYQEYLDGTKRASGWTYPIEEIYDGVGFKNFDGYIEFKMASCPYFEVAVTERAPMPYNKELTQLDDWQQAKENLVKMQNYMGTDSEMLLRSELIYNPSGNYIAPPMVKSATPKLNTTQFIGSTYDVTIEYDDILLRNEQDLSMDVSIIDPRLGITKVDSKDYKVEDFKFDGESTFTFKFTPSEMFADDSVYYEIKFNGVVGSRSGKEPIATSYFCAHRCAAYAYKAQGIDFNIFGKPILMDDLNVSDLEVEDIPKEKLQELSDLLKYRLTLVTTETTPGEDKAMVDFLNEKGESEGDIDLGDGLLKTQTYNISLTVCKKQAQMIKTGTSLRVMVGFPVGYGPEDAGVTFKAYHYNKNEQGEITSVEEIPCTVTELGLVIEVKSFSPFTIAAIDKDEVTTDKKVIVTTNDGGSVTDESDQKATILTLKAGNNVKIKLTPDDEHEIEEFYVGEADKEQSLVQDNGKTKTYELKYEELAEGTTIVKADFVSSKVKEAEQGQEVEVVKQPAVANPTFVVSSKILESADVESDATQKEVNSLLPGQKFEVVFSVDSYNAVEGSGVNAIGGNLNFDTDKLELIEVKESVKASEEVTWTSTYERGNNGFTVETDNTNKVLGEFLKAEFKVKENADPVNASGVASISLTDLQAGTGKLALQGITPVASASDIQRSINIKEAEKEGTLVSKVETQNYRVGDNYIVIPAGETVTAFEGKVETSLTAKYFRTVQNTIEKDNPESAIGLTKSVSIEPEDLLHTGDKVTVGNNSWIVVVRGDVDGDGTASLTDFSKIKLHCIKKEPLYGSFLEAADNDDDNNVGINDVSRYKLFLVKKIQNLFENVEN